MKFHFLALSTLFAAVSAYSMQRGLRGTISQLYDGPDEYDVPEPVLDFKGLNPDGVNNIKELGQLGEKNEQVQPSEDDPSFPGQKEDDERKEEEEQKEEFAQAVEEAEAEEEEEDEENGDRRSLWPIKRLPPQKDPGNIEMNLNSRTNILPQIRFRPFDPKNLKEGVVVIDEKHPLYKFYTKAPRKPRPSYNVAKPLIPINRFRAYGDLVNFKKKDIFG